MADRYKGLEGVPSTTPEPEEKVGEPKTTPPAPEPGSEKYAGKSQEELISMLRDAESRVGQREQEFGELRKRIGVTEAETNRLAQEIKARDQAILSQQKPREVEVDESRWDFAHPATSTAKLAREQAQALLQEQEERRKKEGLAQYQDYAKRQYEAGMRRAFARNPDLFDGIQEEVQNGMYQGYANGKLDADSLGTEDMWDMMGKNVRLAKNQIDVLVKLQRPSSVSPMPAPRGNAPQQVKDDGGSSAVPGGIQYDSKTYAIMEKFGLTEDQAREIIRSQRANDSLEGGR